MLIPLILIPSNNKISINSDKLINTVIELEPFKFGNERLSFAVIINMENGARIVYAEANSIAECEQLQNELIDYINSFMDKVEK